MFCSECGIKIQNSAVFCASCGTKIETQQQDTWYQQGMYSDNQALKPAPSPEVTDAESKSIASLVMGIISIVTSFFIVGLILGPLAISNGKKARLVLNEKNHNFWIALAGIITGIIGLVMSIIVTIWWVIFVILLTTQVKEYVI